MTVELTGRCSGCGACIATCPEAALTRGPGGPVVSDLRCSECLACIEVCPTDALEICARAGRGGA